MQSRMMSFIEALANVLAGYVVAVGTQVIIFPLLGLRASLDQNLRIALILTVLSPVRGYVLRHVFDRPDS